ncbi:uncharacterized protein [Centruroides vittatus]|uniref:uncharacterized protein n=1 Tax=Centruroides vittatus TaxID=120091 RepID=UPI0035104ABE
MKPKEQEGHSRIASDSSHPSGTEQKRLGHIKRRSIPTGFDFDLDEVWLPKIQMRSSRRMSKDAEDPLCRTVPSQFYSRHQLLKGDHTLQPSIHNSNNTPVYVYKPGREKNNNQPWPSRAHDGTANRQQEGRNDAPIRQDDDNFDADTFDF